MGLPLYRVDAFADRPFAGNPAAVCLLPGPCDAAWMQAVAAEMNLSETAFLYRQADGFSLRWFTPTVEVDLCGHATLASAHVLWEAGLLHPDEPARFHTRSGLLRAARSGEEIELDFPAIPIAPATAPEALRRALGVPFAYVGRTRADYLVELGSEAAVRRLQPDLARIRALGGPGVIVTSRADPGQVYDIVSRYFDPAEGIDEDPVCGSAHCALGPFWCERQGKDELVAYQASARGGTLRVRMAGERVHLLGRATTVLQGEWVAS